MIVIGAGISGLSISYFLSQKGIKHEVIERKFVGYKKDTSLVCENIKKFFDVENFVIEEFNTANFYYNEKFAFSVKSSKKMLLIDRNSFEKYIYKNIDKKFAKFNFFEEVIDVNIEKNEIITNKRKIKFDFLIDASGPSFLVGKKFCNPKYVIAYEAIAKKVKDGINLFFDKKISKNFFGWIVGCKNFSKIGIMDFGMRKECFLNFLKFFNAKPKEVYGNLINISIPKKFFGKNFAIVGEAAGIIKNFSLGGINFAIISSFLLSKYLDNLKKYERSIKKVFYSSIMKSRILRFLFKNFDIRFFKPLRFFTKSVDPDFLIYI
jgi:flavin-dependent dehydrogenase